MSVVVHNLSKCCAGTSVASLVNKLLLRLKAARVDHMCAEDLSRYEEAAKDSLFGGNAHIC